MTRNNTRFPSGMDPALNTAFHTHRIGGVMAIPDQLRPHFRLLREWVRQVLQVEAVINGPLTDAAKWAAPRAGGKCVCDQCGLFYADHPPCVWEPSITLLCDGGRVKL